MIDSADWLCRNWWYHFATTNSGMMIVTTVSGDRRDSTAIATRDYQDVHHDRDKAQAKGSKDIFVNILTDTGLVGRYVTDWAGPNAIIKSIKLRLGVPWYAYDTITFRGEVTAVDGELVTLKVVGSNSLGDHVIATSTLTMGAQ